MTLADYYKILGLPVNSSAEDIKKAYRNKARQFHPDINHSPEAKDLFISATEAYEFLLAYNDKLNTDDQAYRQAMEDWRKYRQDRSRKRATVYARSSYNTFKNTRFYKTTRIFDGTTIILGFAISILVVVCTIFGYFFRLNHPIIGLEKPSLFSFVMLLMLGITFFVVSFTFLKAYIESSKKRKKKQKPVGTVF